LTPLRLSRWAFFLARPSRHRPERTLVVDSQGDAIQFTRGKHTNRINK
jgi:hypothetical protein